MLNQTLAKTTLTSRSCYIRVLSIQAPYVNGNYWTTVEEAKPDTEIHTFAKISPVYYKITSAFQLRKWYSTRNMYCLRFILSTILLGPYVILKVNGSVTWDEPPTSSYENATGKSVTLDALFGGSTAIDPSWSYRSSSTPITVCDGNLIKDTVYCSPSTCSIDMTNGKYDLTINSLQRGIHNGTWRIEQVDAIPVQYYDTDISVKVNVETIIILEYTTGQTVQGDIGVTYPIACVTYNADPPPMLTWYIDDILLDNQPVSLDVPNSDGTYISTSTLQFTPNDSDDGKDVNLKCKAEQPLLTEDRIASLTFSITNGSVSGSCSVIGVLLCLLVCSAVAISW